MIASAVKTRVFNPEVSRGAQRGIAVIIKANGVVASPAAAAGRDCNKKREQSILHRRRWTVPPGAERTPHGRRGTLDPASPGVACGPGPSSRAHTAPAPPPHA